MSHSFDQPISTYNSLLANTASIFKSSLKNFANHPNFSEQMMLAFGNEINVDLLRASWQTNNVTLPSIEIVSASNINNANGAFSGDTNTIYLSREFLTANQFDLDAVNGVLLEEYGHYLDHQLNLVDSPGDEGAIFSALVRGEELTDSELQQLRSEDDSAVVNIDGEEVAIEQAIDSFAPLEEHPIHAFYENLARNFGNTSVYSDAWQVGQVVTSSTSPTTEYRVDQIFEYPTHDFYAVGLVPVNSTTEDETPILVIRGTSSIYDWYFNFDPNGIGYPQLQDAINNTNDNGVSIYQWLDDDEHSNAALIGESLGGALAQGIAADYTKNGGNIGEVVTFSSPGINVDQVDDFQVENAGEVTHYVTDGDPVVLAGRKYLPGEWWLTDMESVINPFDRHQAMTLNPGNESNIVNQQKFDSTSELNSGLFGYSDCYYVQFQVFLGVAGSLLLSPVVGTTIAAGITYRETTEALRQTFANIGNLAFEIVQKTIELLENGVNFLVEFLDTLAEAGEEALEFFEDNILQPIVKEIFTPLSEYAEDFANSLSAIGAAINGDRERIGVDVPDRATFAVEKEDGNLKINWDDSLSNTYLGNPGAELAITSIEDNLTIIAPQFERQEVVAEEYRAAIEFDLQGGRVGGTWEKVKDIRETIIHPNFLQISTSDVEQITIEGTDFDDRIFTTGSTFKPLIVNAKAGNDLVQGNSYDDTLSGNDGNDTLSGADGNDVINGGNGNDIINGETGNDTIDGGDGDDIVNGGDGNDTLRPSYGDDTVSGGAGNDLLVIDYSDLPTGAVVWNRVKRFEYEDDDSGTYISNAYGLDTPFIDLSPSAYSGNSLGNTISADGSTVLQLGELTEINRGLYVYQVGSNEPPVTIVQEEEFGELLFSGSGEDATSISDDGSKIAWVGKDPDTEDTIISDGKGDGSDVVEIGVEADLRQFIESTPELAGVYTDAELSSNTILTVREISLSGDGSTVAWTVTGNDYNTSSMDRSYGYVGIGKIEDGNAAISRSPYLYDDASSTIFLSNPSLSFDGSQIAWLRGDSNNNYQVLTADTEFTSIVQVSPPPNNPNLYYSPSISNDGSTVVFLEHGYIISPTFGSGKIFVSKNNNPATEIYQIPDGLYPITFGNGTINIISTSPDGERIFFNLLNEETNEITLNVINSDGTGEVTQIYTGNPIENDTFIYDSVRYGSESISSSVNIGVRYGNFDRETGSGEIITWGPSHVEFDSIERFDFTGTPYGDELFGGNNADILTGAGGADTLQGGGGDDTYKLDADTAAGSIIRDTAGGDSLELNNGTLSLAQPAANTIGLARGNTTLIIDLNQDGIIDPEQDLSILDYFAESSAEAGNGFIENVANLSGNDILNLLPPGESVEVDNIDVSNPEEENQNDNNNNNKTGSSSTVYRFLNPDVGVHFYTANEVERDAVLELPNYTFEGESYNTVDPLSGNAEDVYRFFNTNTGVHLYTTDENERDYITDNLAEFTFEGTAFSAYETEAEGTIPIYRFFNGTTGAHFYTPSIGEKDSVEANLPDFAFEGVAYHAFPLNQNT